MITDRQLRQYLAGALEPPRAEEVEVALAADPATRERLAVLRATTVAEPVAAGWTLPPPQVHTPTSLAGSARWGAVMDVDGPAWISLRVEVPDDADHHLVVVLERTAAAWEVVSPTAPDEVVRVHELPREGPEARLDVAIEATDAVRLGVVLVPEALAPTWADADPWAAVRDAVAEGRLPVATFTPPAPS